MNKQSSELGLGLGLGLDSQFGSVSGSNIEKINLDNIDISDLFENKEKIIDFNKSIKTKENLTNIKFKISITLITSDLNYKRNKVIKFENFLYEKKEALETINNCLSHIDATMGRYFLENNSNNNDIILDFPNVKNQYLSDDIHYTEKVENYCLKIIGKDLFKWDWMIFFFNKIIFVLTCFSWFYKFDFSTVRNKDY